MCSSSQLPSSLVIQLEAFKWLRFAEFSLENGMWITVKQGYRNINILLDFPKKWKSVSQMCTIAQIEVIAFAHLLDRSDNFNDRWADILSAHLQGIRMQKQSPFKTTFADFSSHSSHLSVFSILHRTFEYLDLCLVSRMHMQRQVLEFTHYSGASLLLKEIWLLCSKD